MFKTRTTSRASCGQSAMIPSSVLLLSDLGSRFMEPMKTCLWSITAALACRLPSEAPGSLSRSLEAMRRGLSGFTATVLGDNRRALRLLRRAFPNMQAEWSSGQYTLDMPFERNAPATSEER